MRLSEIFRPSHKTRALLHEHDVVNVRKVDRYIDDLTLGWTEMDPRSLRWMRRTLRRIILNNPNWITGPLLGTEKDVAIRGAMNDAEYQLAKQKIENGEKIYVFTSKDKRDIDLHVEHVIDYFASLEESKEIDDVHIRQEVERRLNQLSHLKTIRDVSEEADQWFDFIQKWKVRNNQTEDAVGTETVIELPHGWRWVRVFEEGCLNREGVLMGHCVGSYAHQVASGRVVIYSLRDPTNEPHVTVEVKVEGERRTVDQVKGKQNVPPVPKYWPAIAALLNWLGARVDPWNHDIASTGLVKRNDRWGTIPDIAELVASEPFRVYALDDDDGARRTFYVFDADGSDQIMVLYGRYGEEDRDDYRMIYDFNVDSPVDYDLIAIVLNAVLPKLVADDWNVGQLREHPPTNLIYHRGRFFTQNQLIQLAHQEVAEAAEGVDLEELLRRLDAWRSEYLSHPNNWPDDFMRELIKIFPHSRRSGGRDGSLLLRSDDRRILYYDGRRFHLAPKRANRSQ